MNPRYLPSVWLRRLFAATLGLSLLTAMASPVKFNLPAQPLAEALVAFSKQAGVDVLYSSKELKKAISTAVTGEYEPAAALTQLLQGTGFAATQDGAKFLIRQSRVAQPGGTVKGTLLRVDGQGAEGVRVLIRETGQNATTDANGDFVFTEVPAGTFLLVATAGGYQPLHLTEVRVQAGQSLILSKQRMRTADEVTRLQPYVVRAEAVTQLERYEVTGTRENLFASGNMDLPRTINDVQPYYIFDEQTLGQSGAVNVEDFLKQRLTMNAVIQTYSQNFSSTVGNTSNINLRGVGTDQTLILVDGRRQAGVASGSINYQADLNGIPMDAIERIEVLPSSASGIYGGSAIGGVVNVITKRNYQGGEIRTTYDNSFDTDSAKRTVSLSYGRALEGGKTHFSFSASWSDANDLLMQDRLDLVKSNYAAIMAHSPTFITSAYALWHGALPNITTTSASLILKNGTSLNSKYSYVPAGTSTSTSSTTLASGLTANAGQWNLEFPSDNNFYSGRLRSLGNSPRVRSLRTSLRRQMRPWLEAYADFSVNQNNTVAPYGIGSSATVTLAAGVAGNPFSTPVTISVVDNTPNYIVTKTQSSSVSAGLLAQLPAGWILALDYTGSQTRFRFDYSIPDTTARTADATSGVLNLFVDQSLYPLDLSKYQAPYWTTGKTYIHDVTLKGTGKLPSLPWGQPTLTVGLEHRLERATDGQSGADYPITTANSYVQDYYPRSSTDDSSYAEVLVPLVKTGWLRGVHALELQASGRAERYTVDTGTTYKLTYFEGSPVATSYSGALLNGLPYFSKVHYDSTNYTVGLKYQPVKDITLRVSRATAFLPPTMAQLSETQDRSTSTTNVTDPVTGKTTAVYTISGGNADVTPQHATSTNFGVIWEPSWKPLQGLRLNAEYYKIEQSDAIGTLTAQQIVNMESLYPDRVIRNSSGTITTVNISSLNLYQRETEGWDLSASYTRRTGLGTFRLDAVESIVTHLKTQYSLTSPAYDAVNFPSEGGTVKYKGNATLNWSWRKWTASWTTRYYSRYKEYGAAGGPNSLRYANGGTYSYYVAAQGSDWVASQTYHDLNVGYDFGRNRAGSQGFGLRLLDGVAVQAGVRNLFDKAPPLDAYYSNSQLFMSPYGDMRLRTYWISLKKAF